MKRLLWLGTIVLFAGIATAKAEDAPAVKTEDAKAPAKEETPAPKGEADLLAKVSYIIGMNIGSQFKQDGVEANVAEISKGIKDGLSGAKSALTEEQMKDAMQEFQKMMVAKQQEKVKQQAADNAKQGEKNIVEGKAFLDENKKKEGVQTTASGLQYKVLKEGEGEKPKATDQVTVHYKGTFLDGNEFDSSYKRKEPVSFPLDKVIKGWTEGVQLMKVGAKYQFWIPENLAYGKDGRPGIPPGSTLIFEVELIAIGTPAAKDAEK